MREPREVLEVKESRLAVSESCNTTEITEAASKNAPPHLPAFVWGAKWRALPQFSKEEICAPHMWLMHILLLSVHAE
jgi:hypothetical protein